MSQTSLITILEVLDRMRQVIVARAYQYADDPVGATGMMVKDYRGKNGERAIWKFDAALVSQSTSK